MYLTVCLCFTDLTLCCCEHPVFRSVKIAHTPVASPRRVSTLSRVLVFSQGTVLIKTAQELLDYSKGEENVVEEVRALRNQ